MSRRELFVRHDAELDALGYFHYIHEHNPDAALRFLEAIDATVLDLAAQPLSVGYAASAARICKVFVRGA